MTTTPKSTLVTNRDEKECVGEKDGGYWGKREKGKKVGNEKEGNSIKKEIKPGGCGGGAGPADGGRVVVCEWGVGWVMGKRRRGKRRVGWANPTLKHTKKD